MTIDIVEIIVFSLLGAAALLAMVRMWMGPYAPDRIVATDTLSVIATAAIVFLAQFFGSPLYLDVALLYGVLAFVGVVALARAIEGGRQ